METSVKKVYFSHGEDKKSTKFTIACTAIQEDSTKTKFVYGVTACSKTDSFSYKEGRNKAELFLNEKPYSYTINHAETENLVDPDVIKKHLGFFAKNFEKKSVRKFIYKTRNKK